MLIQTFMLAFSTAIGQLIVALMFIWTARSEGPEMFGPVVAAISAGSTLAGFVDFGSNSLWVRELATQRMSLASVGHRLASKLAVGALVAVGWSAIFAMVAPATQLWIAGPIAVSVILSQSFAVPLRAAGRSDLVAIGMLVDRLVAISAFSVLLAVQIEPTLALWLSMTVGPVTASAVSRWVLSGSQKPTLKFSPQLNPWKGSRHFGLSSAAVSAQTLDISIMDFIAGPAAAGLYGAVNRWTQPMSLLAGAFTTASTPIVAQAATWKDAWPKVKRSAWLVLGAVFMCVAVAYLADPLVIILVGPEYADAGKVLQFLALGTIGAVLNQPLASFLQSLGRDRIVSTIVTSGVAVQLALVAFLSLQLGAFGASLAFCALQTMILILLILAIVTKKRMPRLPSGRHFRQ
ncbi:polysaccharide biosynthesis C-terminal domain-containing protein [Arthrobacter sp. ISL-48]|uniref:polysaccharide biosynthesis C-terminal domain-containing protein n=1 Tax=Arthrobacter sp. ISL-48 TaxID=2819110 RepID=UPI001BE95023|nr:polysaccharide biosynthesis C-terminal domain-containing protein [Arthrobacter sp. ISL-48]MBT2534313.1 polysaccharide biosynthesis C-terminal domain-containing protein [Arthrobacter sp. ISL-48]